MREIEKIYSAYLDEIENKLSDEEILQPVRVPNKEKITNMFKQPLKNISLEKSQGINQGNIYLMFLDQTPVYFVVIDEIDNVFEVLKMSKWVELANHNDLLTKVDDEWFIIETWNNFYLSKEEILDSVYFGKLPEEDLKILLKFLNEEIEELPENKRGIFATSENSYQIKFHKKESEIVRQYKFRIFEEEENIIELSPEREEQIKLELVAGKEKTTARGENFVLYADLENNIFKLILPSNLQGKKANLKIFDETQKLEELPEEIIIKAKNPIRDLDIEKLAENIKVEIQND